MKTELTEQQKKVYACISYLSNFYKISKDDFIDFIIRKILNKYIEVI